MAWKNTDRSVTAEALASIAEAQYQKGEIRRARRTIDSIGPLKGTVRGKFFYWDDFVEYSVEYLLNESIEIQAKFGDVTGVQHTMNISNDPYWQLEVFEKLAIGLARQGKGDDAQKALDSALHIMEGVSQDGYIGQDSQQTFNKEKDAELKYRLIETIALIQAYRGDIETAKMTAQEIEQGKRSILEQIADIQLERGDGDGAKITLQSIGINRLRIPELLTIAIQRAKEGDVAGAYAYFAEAIADAKESFYSSDSQAEEFKDIAISQARAGFPDNALQAAEQITINIEEHLPEIAAVFAETGDKEHFKRLLLPCAGYVDAAYAMCGHLARLYPEQAAAIANVLLKHEPLDKKQEI